MSARESILDTLCAHAASTGQLHLRCQRQPVLQWELHPEYYHRCGNPHPTYAIHLDTAACKSAEARFE